MRESILIVDDDVCLSGMIVEFLRSHGYDADAVDNGPTAETYIQNQPPKLVLLDLMLPGKDGLSVCRDVRRYFHGPIVMFTALGDDVDHVVGLETGADDYLAKPVSPRVLLARVRAMLRRHSTQAAGGVTEVRSAGLVINSSSRTVMQHQRRIDLTTAEFELLWLLAQNKGRIVSRELLHDTCIFTPFDPLDRSIDLRVSRLRRKIGDDPRAPALIKTVRGRGYQLADLPPVH
ncbi:response regulator transcription factor [Tahibacter amnicola]|uniref:Response regulator transcription factor n=1 Tax=Tahibacter amnicola TaxID=2976241 RepID=A0ABY6BG53_9GAMM|nr:response regulator transcription factor [Tahibacter amnicola]UXI69006.1 response regulator transcription factor [Tahibacter amnicola]